MHRSTHAARSRAARLAPIDEYDRHPALPRGKGRRYPDDARAEHHDIRIIFRHRLSKHLPGESYKRDFASCSAHRRPATRKVPFPTNHHQNAACESATFLTAVASCSATFVAFQPTFIGVDYMAALLGNVLGTVDGLLGTATGVLGGASASGSASASASGTADLSNVLDLGAVVETNPSIDLSAGLDGVDAS